MSIHDLKLRILTLPPIKHIRRLWAKNVTEVSAGTITFCCISSDSQPEVLLIERGAPFDDWVFPKGKVKEGEGITEAAIRETKEETGLDVGLLKKIRSYEYTYYWDPKNERATKTVHYFLAQANANNCETTAGLHPDDNRESGSFKQVIFVPFEEAMTLVKHEVERELLRECLQVIRSKGSGEGGQRTA